jgi:hypothetical protein
LKDRPPEGPCDAVLYSLVREIRGFPQIREAIRLPPSQREADFLSSWEA